MAETEKCRSRIMRETLRKWKKETKDFRRHIEKMRHPLFAEIVAFDEDQEWHTILRRVLFEELQKEKDTEDSDPVMFLLLAGIFKGQSPEVPRDCRSNVWASVDAWLKFGAEQGYFC